MSPQDMFLRITYIKMQIRKGLWVEAYEAILDMEREAVKEEEANKKDGLANLFR